MSDSSALDTAVEIITPENIAFRYRVAGPFRRLPAYLIDFGIRLTAWMITSVAVMIAFSSLGLPGFGLAATLIIIFALTWLYGGLFEALWNGQTPGKRLMNIRVLTVEGRPINGWQAVLRNVLRAADMMPLMFYLVGFLSAMLTPRFQRLGDLAAGTMVVVEEPKWFQGVIRLREAEVVRLAGQIPPGFQASRTTARALAAYVQRRPQFSAPRRAEIAGHLGRPLRRQFNLPPETNLDLLLAAVYHHTFVTDRREEERVVAAGSPFAPIATSPFAPPSEPADQAAPVES
ncbi:MAG: RDD family protein [Rhodopirellula sp.]|nr:RDD family protein [Rhodopirellula sp.]